VAGRIYEAIHYAAYRLISTVAKPSLHSFLNITNQVSHRQL